jgi:hypothetical protein
MPITQTNFTQVEVLKPMLMTDTQKTLVGNIIDNITADRDALATLKDESQAKFNEVIDSVNALQEGTDVDIAALEDNINAILYLESEAGNESFTGMFTKLFKAINDRKETLAFTTQVTSSPNGQVILDLTAYEFKSLSEYELQVAVTTDDSGRNLEATAKKLSTTQAVVTIRDNDRLSFVENAESFYDAAVKGQVELVTIIVRTAKPIGGHLTSVAGVETHLGHDISEHMIVTGTSLKFKDVTRYGTTYEYFVDNHSGDPVAIWSGNVGADTHTFDQLAEGDNLVVTVGSTRFIFEQGADLSVAPALIDQVSITAGGTGAV